ncbi:MAG: hypothetical protein COC05_06760 [Gammaproteobacteria bacterium]|nr:MAG: hypothetical protein COC05_06760 [Gammaproteobacteria bacterium]
MNKKLLAVAVASAIAAPMAASADSSLTVYGGVGVAVESIDIDTADALAVNNNHSALGFEGSTDVNSSLAAVFHWDAFVNIDNAGGDGSLIGGGRDGWAGLRGSFGTVALGFQGRPWKTLSHALDPFEGTIADYSSVLGNSSGGSNFAGGQGFDTGVGNSIIWFGPNLNGFTWHAQYGAEDSDNGANNYGVQGNYSNDRFLVGLSYDLNEDTTNGANTDDLTAIKLVGSVNFGAATITGAYEQLDGIGFDSNADRDAIWLAGSYDFGHGSVRLSYSLADEVNNDDNGADQISVGYFGKLSDNATWYALYSQISNDDNGAYGFVSAPHTSSIDSSLSNQSVVAGNDSRAIGLGIKYNFAADLI